MQSISKDGHSLEIQGGYQVFNGPAGEYYSNYFGEEAGCLGIEPLVTFGL